MQPKWGWAPNTKSLKGVLEVMENKLKNGLAKDELAVFILGQCDGGWALKQIWQHSYLSQVTVRPLEDGVWMPSTCNLLLFTGSARRCQFTTGRGHMGGYRRASVLLQIQTPVPSQYCVHRGMPLITLNRQMHDADWKFQTYGHARSFVSLVGEALEMSWGVTKTCCYPRSAFEWCVSTCLG